MREQLYALKEFKNRWYVVARDAGDGLVKSFALDRLSDLEITGKSFLYPKEFDDRHCPKCQKSKQALWVEKVTRLTLPVKHIHIIFTVPHHLNRVCLWNPAMYYNLLFSAVWRTLHSFGYSHYGAETGAIAVLHSWGQNLSLHPHIHCIVPAAGYSLKGKWKRIGKEKYLYPVHQLSTTFKGKFLDSLKRKFYSQRLPRQGKTKARVTDRD